MTEAHLKAEHRKMSIKSMLIERGMKCCKCEARPCLRTVGKKGYCRSHTPEAFAEAKRVGCLS